MTPSKGALWNIAVHPPRSTDPYAGERAGSSSPKCAGFSYDADGNLTSITDTVGRTVTLDYDTHNHIVQLTDPIRRRVQYSYDADRTLISYTDPSGGMMLYSYDAVHRVTQITDQRGNTLLKNSYETVGRVVDQTNGRGLTRKFAYGVRQPRDTSITDPLGNTTIHTHDDQFRLIAVTEPDSLDNKITFTYDEDNRGGPAF
jgi:YD repeat-containing protein